MSRILVADDAPALRAFLQRCVEVAGHEPVMAADGREAIAILRGTAPVDAVVVDHAMPGASGLEVIIEARRVDPLLPCVIVTAHDDLDLAVAALQAGAAAFLPKPFRPDHLRAVLDRVLERRRTADPAAAKGGGVGGERAMVLGARTAVELGVSAEEAVAAGMGAALRDVGLAGVSGRLLASMAPDAVAEAQIRRNHAHAGAALLEGVAGAAMVRAAISHHHERWDGTGHPDGLSGADIPLVARIAAAVDAFEDLADRPGASRRPTVAQARRSLRALAGSALDPQVVEALLAALGGADAYVEVAGHAARVEAAT